MINEHYQIGEVAEMVGLSLRTIRYYEEIELVSPSGRTEGGFRLYTDSDVSRLRIIKSLKPIGLSLETMGDLLAAIDHLEGDEKLENSDQRRIAEVLALALKQCDEMEERIGQARQVLEGLVGRSRERA